MSTLTNTHIGTPSRDIKPKYPGNYLGIVVQNNDPEHRGQIKVWVPHVSPTVYKDWLNSKEDKKFKFIGDNISSDLTGIMDDLKEILPWAQCAAPLVGASGSGRYNAHLKTGSISDSSRVEEIDPKDDFVQTKYSLNKDGIGEKPSRVYEVDDLRLNDAFTDTAANQTNKINKYSYNYTPTSYSNAAKGTFSIPNVGAHVWVFFQGGDPMAPVYFATSFGEEDWKGIYDIEDDNGIDYPGTYENKSTNDDPSYNHNTETYRNKFVFNQKGGSLEIVSTDNKELLKMTHFGGSFLEFNNDTTVQLAAKNDQKLVLEDQYQTIKGFRNLWVERDYDFLVRGDFYTKVGNFNRTYIEAWRNIIANIANYKQLFEIKRCGYDEKNKTGNEFLKRVSPHQLQSGTYAPCPVCSSGTRENIWNFDYTYSQYVSVNSTATITSNLLAGDWIGSTGGASDTADDSNDFSSVTSIINSPVLSAPTVGTVSSFLGGTCPCCGGSLKSPSSQGGTWDNDDRKDEKVTEQLRENISKLLILEKEMGVGGSSITNITKHKVENIGLVFNDLPSIRVDHFGKINKSDVRIQPGGVVTNQKASPLVEYVHVDDLPGGTYNLNVCNRYNVQVGAGGVQMKSYGPVDISGTVTNIAGDQVNIASDLEINIESKGRINIAADILSLRQKNYGQVLVDSNLGVTQNVIIGGGMHVEGELTVQHVTAPVEFQQTEAVEQAVKLLTGNAFQVQLNDFDVTDSGLQGSGIRNTATGTITFTDASSYAQNEDIGYTTPHSHQFRNLPLTLMQKDSDVRQVGKNNENAGRTGPFEIKHQKKDAQSFDNDDIV